MKMIGLVIFLTGITLSPVFADYAVLRDGSTVEGVILRKSKTVLVMRTTQGRMSIPMHLVAKVFDDNSIEHIQNLKGEIQPETLQKIDKLLSLQPMLNRNQWQELQTLSLQTSPDFRKAIYESDPWWEIGVYPVLNVVPMLGSFIQRDYWGALAIGLGYLTSALLFSDSYHFHYIEDGGYFKTLNWEPAGDPAISVAAVTLMFSIIRPLWLEVRSHLHLRKAMGYTGRQLSYRHPPIFRDNTPGIALVQYTF